MRITGKQRFVETIGEEARKFVSEVAAETGEPWERAPSPEAWLAAFFMAANDWGGFELKEGKRITIDCKGESIRVKVE